MKKFQILTSCILAVSFIVGASGSIYTSSLAEAKPISNRDANGRLTASKATIQLKQKEQKDVSDISKKTGIARNDIVSIMDKGLTIDNVKVVCTMSFLSKDSINKITEKYLKLSLDEQKILEEYNINIEDYNKKYQSLFNSSDDEIQRNNISWRKNPK